MRTDVKLHKEREKEVPPPPVLPFPLSLCHSRISSPAVSVFHHHAVRLLPADGHPFRPHGRGRARAQHVRLPRSGRAGLRDERLAQADVPAAHVTGSLSSLRVVLLALRFCDCWWLW